MTNTKTAWKEGLAFQGDKSCPSFVGSGYFTTLVQHLYKVLTQTAARDVDMNRGIMATLHMIVYRTAPVNMRNSARTDLDSKAGGGWPTGWRAVSDLDISISA